MKWVNKMLNADELMKTYNDDDLTDYYRMKVDMKGHLAAQIKEGGAARGWRLSQGILSTEYPVFDDILYPMQEDDAMQKDKARLEKEGRARDAKVLEANYALNNAAQSRAEQELRAQAAGAEKSS